MKLIACVDNAWAIGGDGKTLFSISGDLKYFKEKTLGHTVVMGRKTFDSLPDGKPLTGRRNIVLTRDPEFAADGVTVCNNGGELAGLLRGMAEDAYVIGGGEVYRELLPFCDTAYITKVDSKALGADTFMPDLDKTRAWAKTNESEEHEENGLKYRFVTYKKHTIL